MKVLVVLILLKVCYAASFQGLLGAFSFLENSLLQNINEVNGYFSGMNTIIGQSEVSALSLFHEICKGLMYAGLVKPLVNPTTDHMFFELYTTCGKSKVPIRNSRLLLQNKQFDKSKPVVLFIDGWLSYFLDHATNPIVKAYNCRGDSNVMVLDASSFISTLYSWSAFNTDAVGRIVAKGLAQLRYEIPEEKIHLIGFSLGAQIAGSAARYYKDLTGVRLKRVTGLDPANPCFGVKGLKPIMQGDAKFVDIIHTNPGVFGERNPLGDIDFYIQGLDPIKPGCDVFGCSHMRALDYYAETVYPGHEFDFYGRHCENIESDLCTGLQVPMGYKTPFNNYGIYEVGVNSESPFGKNASYNALISSQCGTCI